MKMPAIGDSVLFHPSRAETLPEGTVLKARVSGVDENGKLSLTVLDDSGAVVSSRRDVIFIQDDRGAVPGSGYAVLPVDAGKASAKEEKSAAKESPAHKQDDKSHSKK